MTNSLTWQQERDYDELVKEHIRQTIKDYIVTNIYVRGRWCYDPHGDYWFRWPVLLQGERW